ncbi:NUDIX hydrolase [Glycocaulis sp.]|uniref:NUDIX hydrolase n=1 Tax=Glycocaulis sp. TaxID=1969725 RepID=UPI003F6F4EB1
MSPSRPPLPVSKGLVVGLNAVIFASEEGEPRVLVTQGLATPEAALPFGPFDPEAHRTFEIGLREWVRGQTGFELGYVEQLYTFGDRGREAPLAALTGAAGGRVISLGYLGLAREARELSGLGARWASWNEFFPWEDHRHGRPPLIDELLAPALRSWADEAGAPGGRAARLERVRTNFALDGLVWNEERALDRYELLYEAGLVAEAARDQGEPSRARTGTGQIMASDHRRILATAISRLRGKVKYRPVVFELMGETFTLSELQRMVEGIAGFALHKQNFRRALDRAGFVEGTGRFEARTGGRPAELYRFCKEAVNAGPALGLAIPRLK